MRRQDSLHLSRARTQPFLPLYTSVPLEVQCLMQLRVHLKQVPQKNYACVCGRLLIKICGWFSQKPKLEESSAPAAKRGRRPGRRSIEPPEKKKKPEDSRTECCVCKQSGTNSNLVRYAGKFTIVTETIMHLVYPPPPGIWHNHCLRFLLGRLQDPREIMVHYGLGEGGEDFNVS